MIIKEIPIPEINLEDRRFKFTLGTPEEKMIRSIKEIGVVNPVKVIKRDGRYVLVSGWKRVEGAIACGFKRLSILELPEDFSDLEVFTLIFFENYAQTRFSLAEKALAIKKFSVLGLSDAGIITRILPLLELPPARQTYQVLLELSSLHEALPIVHLKDWKLAAAELFLTFSLDERSLLLPLISGLTQNKQKEIIELFYSLKKRQGKSLGEIVEQPEMAFCLEMFRKDRLAAAEKLLLVLRKEINPGISSRGEEIDRELKQLGLPESIRMNYDRTLEETSLTLQVRIDSEQELRKAIDEISRSLDEKNWSKLFELLHNKTEE